MTRQFVLDVAERAGFTALQAFAAAWVVTSWSDVTDVGLAKQAAVAAIAAALATLKGVAASRVGDPGTAAMLPSVGPDAKGE